MELTPGQIVDRYEVLSELGRGGMATVYRVRHTTLGSEHALKLLQLDGKALASRLIAEGRVQAGLDHPHAVRVTDVVVIEDHPALVMELLTDGTLTDWIDRHRPRRDERLACFDAICGAVAAAHALGLVHRDLKPDNVLMKRTETGWTPKVADFGLVKAVDAAPVHDGPHTRQGTALGTPGYMAPEQIENAARVDARADVYSLGAVLVWMLTGEAAVPGDTMLDTFANVAAGVHHNVPDDDPLHPVVARAMARTASDRFGDAGALQRALREARGEAVPSVPPPPRPNPAPALWLGGGALVLGSFATVLLVGFVLVVLFATRGSVPTPSLGVPSSDCPRSGGKRIGYVKVDGRVSEGLGDVYTLATAGHVLARPRDEESGVCSLPAGTRITLKERPGRARSGTWLPVYADAWE